MPLANVPLIDYAIEYLSDNNIEEVYVVCTHHSQKISEYIKSQHYKTYRNLKITTITCKDENSFCGALRSLADHYSVEANVLNKDFIVIRGDVITNIPLNRAVKDHFERKAKGEKVMITKTFARMCSANRIRVGEDDIAVVLDPEKNLLKHYKRLWGAESVEMKGCNIPMDGSLEVRYDLYDCRIDICTPELLYYLKDNFDCKDLQESFVNDINSPNSLADHKVYYYEYADPNHAYCAVIQNPLLYDCVVKDMIKRYAYPLVIDSNLMCPKTNLSFKYTRNNIYIEDNIKLSMTCVVSPNCVIGRDSEVGEGAVIDHSTLGRGCIIGARSQIIDSYLWSGVIVEEDCIITGAIICDKVIIRKHAVISKGTIIDRDVININL